MLVYAETQRQYIEQRQVVTSEIHIYAIYMKPTEQENQETLYAIYIYIYIHPYI